LRERIAKAYRAILHQQPQIAPGVVNDLMNWQQWGLADSLRPITASPPPGMDQASVLQIHAYLRKAQDIADTHPADEETGSGWIPLLITLFLLLALPAGLSLHHRWAARARPS
jgi:hypothetical protein